CPRRLVLLDDLVRRPLRIQISRQIAEPAVELLLLDGPCDVFDCRAMRLGRKPRAIVAERLAQLEVAGIERFGQVRGGEACHAVAIFPWSRRATRLPARWSRRAAVTPAIPPPTTQTSTVASPVRAGKPGSATVRSQRDSDDFLMGPVCHKSQGRRRPRTAPPPYGSGEGKPATQLVLQRQGPQGWPPSPCCSLHARVVPSAASWQVPGSPPS